MVAREKSEDQDPVVVDPTEPLWTVEDVADYLRLEPETVRGMTRDGKLPGFKVGRVWRYRSKEIKKWVQESSNRINLNNAD